MFSEKEMNVLLGGIEKSVKAEQAVVGYIYRIYEKLVSAGLDPIGRLAEISSQEKWDRVIGIGDSKICGDDLFSVGIGGHMFERMLRELGQCQFEEELGYEMFCIVIARAMKKDEKVDRFIRSVVSGAKKVYAEKKITCGNSMYICNTLCSLID